MKAWANLAASSNRELSYASTIFFVASAASSACRGRAEGSRKRDKVRRMGRIREFILKGE